MAAALCYSQTSVIQKEDGIKLLESLSPKKGDVILDLGCGTGYLANVLAERVGSKGKVIAVDPNEARIKLARETSSSTTGNLQFIVGNDQDFPEEEYDIVLCTSTMHWIKDKEPTFKRVYKYLKPEGKFGFTTVEDFTLVNSLFDIFKPFGEDTLAETLGLLHFERAEYYKQLAISTGFEVTLMESINRDCQFSSADSYLDFLYGAFNGKFDRSSPALDDFRREHEGKPVSFNITRINAILSKPS